MNYFGIVSTKDIKNKNLFIINEMNATIADCPTCSICGKLFPYFTLDNWKEEVIYCSSTNPLTFAMSKCWEERH